VKCIAIRRLPFTACCWPTKVAKRSLTSLEGWQAASTTEATGVVAVVLADAAVTPDRSSASAVVQTPIRRMV
jgi:hypothetical protein